MRILFAFLYIIIAGIAAHYVGEALPRRRFDVCAFPYAPFKWEKNGKIYERLYVQRWKDRLPDMSRLTKDMVRKSIRLTGSAAEAARVATETCVAEAVHWVLMLLSFIIYWICPDVWGTVIAIIYGLSHLPFIIIQRYNRPTLALLAQRLKQREERIRNAHPDSVG